MKYETSFDWIVAFNEAMRGRPLPELLLILSLPSHRFWPEGFDDRGKLSNISP